MWCGVQDLCYDKVGVTKTKRKAQEIDGSRELLDKCGCVHASWYQLPVVCI